MKWLIDFIADLFLQFGQPYTPPEVYPQDVKPEIKPEPKYRWGNPEEVRHSIRVIGDEYGATWLQKDLACDICRCESTYLPTATYQNTPKSIDRGLFQINGYYHPEATPENAYNPEWNTRWAYQNGILNGKAKVFWNASAKCWNKDGRYNALLTFL